MRKWKDYNLNDVEFTFLLNTKRHVWQVYFGPLEDKPDLEFTKAKGEAVLKFLNELQRVKKEQRDS